MSPTTSKLAFAATVLLSPGVLAGLNINNWCTVGVSVVQSHNASCDYGIDSVCIDSGGSPWWIAPGTGESYEWFDFIADGIGTSVKIAKDDVSDGVLQYEYSVNSDPTYGGVYWDLSDLDGSGSGLVGTPFGDQNVKVSPTGNGANTGTCLQIRCAANSTCYDSYQTPDDPNTRYCPLDTGDMWIDLCQPDDQFVLRKRAEVNLPVILPTYDEEAREIKEERSAAAAGEEPMVAVRDRHQHHQHMTRHMHGHKRSFRG